MKFIKKAFNSADIIIITMWVECPKFHLTTSLHCIMQLLQVRHVHMNNIMNYLTTILNSVHLTYVQRTHCKPISEIGLYCFYTVEWVSGPATSL